MSSLRDFQILNAQGSGNVASRASTSLGQAPGKDHGASGSVARPLSGVGRLLAEQSTSSTAARASKRASRDQGPADNVKTARHTSSDTTTRQPRTSAGSVLTDPAWSAEFIQLVAKHAPLELGLLSEPRRADSAQQDQRPSVQGGHAKNVAARQDIAAPVRTASAAGSRPPVPQMTASRRLSAAGKSAASVRNKPEYHLRSPPPRPGPGAEVAAHPTRGHVPLDPRLLPNPVDVERALAGQRAQAAAAKAEAERVQAAKRSRVQEKSEDALVAQLEAAVRAANQVAQEESQSLLPLTAPPVPKIRPGKASASTTAAATAKPKQGAREYDRPWAANMAKPGAQPELLAPLPLPQPGGATSGEAQPARDTAPVAMYAPPDLPVMMQEAPLGTAAARPISPGVTRLDKLDQGAHAKLQEFMERKRVVMQQRAREEAERAAAVRTRPLEHRRAESARARAEAKQHAVERDLTGPPPRVRKAWVDIDPSHPAGPSSPPRRARLSPGRQRLTLNAAVSELDPDVDAVSVRVQPNSTGLGLQAERRGSRFRVVSGRLGYGDSVDGSGSGDATSEYGAMSQVIRVRDPVPAQPRRGTRSPHRPMSAQAYPLGAGAAYTSTLPPHPAPPRTMSPPGNQRNVDVLTRRMAAMEYGARVRQMMLEQLEAQKKSARHKLRALRKSRGSAKAARAAAGPSPVAQAAASVFIHQAAEAHHATKKRRPGDRSNTDLAGTQGGRSLSAQRGAAGPLVDAAPARDQGPSEDAVATLKAVVMQLNARIIALQEEAARERTSLSAAGQPGAVRVAWGQPVPGGDPAQLQGIQQYVVPPRYPETALPAQYEDEEGVPPGWGDMRPHSAAGPSRLPVEGSPAREARMQGQGMAPSKASSESPDKLMQMKKPRLSREEVQVDPAAIPRPSRIPAIHVPTSTRRAIPDPNAPFTSPPSEVSRRPGIEDESNEEDEEEEDELMRSGRRAAEDRDRHRDGIDHRRSPQRSEDGSSSSSTASTEGRPNIHTFEDLQSMLAEDDGTAAPQQVEQRPRPGAALGHHTRSGASQDGTVDEEEQDELMRGYYQQPVDGGHRPLPRHPDPQQSPEPRSSSTQHAWARASEPRSEVRESLPLFGACEPPLSPDSDLSQLRLGVSSQQLRAREHEAPPPECEAVVRGQDKGGAEALRLRVAARALQQAADRERLLRQQDPPAHIAPQPGEPVTWPSAQPAVTYAASATWPPAAQPTPTTTLAPAMWQPTVPVPRVLQPQRDPLSIINLATSAMVPRRPVMISLPMPPSLPPPAASVQQQPIPAATQIQTTNTAFPAAQELVDALPPYALPAPDAARPLERPATRQQPSVLPSNTTMDPAQRRPDSFTYSPVTSELSPAAMQQPTHAGLDPHLQQQAGFEDGPGRAQQRPAQVAGGSLLLPPGPERPRLSPADLQNQLVSHINRLDEMDKVGAQLSQLEHARAIAAMQQEAHRIAATLDQTLALQQANTAARTAEQQAEARALEQEKRLVDIAESVRRELRSESLAQLKDVAATFATQIKSNRVAHAEVQTSILDPAPGLWGVLGGMSPLTHSSPSRPGMDVVLGVPATGATDLKTIHTPKAGEVSLGLVAAAHAHAGDVMVPALRSTEDILKLLDTSAAVVGGPGSSGTGSGDVSHEAVTLQSGSIVEDAHQSLRGTTYSMEFGSEVHDSVGVMAPGRDATQAQDGSSGTGSVVASGAGSGSGLSSAKEVTGASGWSPGASTVLHRRRTSGSGSGAFSSIVDSVGPEVAGLQRSVSVGKRLALEPGTPGGTGAPGSGGKLRTPLSEIRASAKGELDCPEEELLEMLQEMEASAHVELARLQARKADVEAAAAAELHRLGQQLSTTATAEEKVAMMGIELKIKLKLNMELGSIERQILAVKDDLTLKKVQVHSLHRLVARLNTPASARPVSGAGTAATETGGPAGASARARAATVTPTRSAAVLQPQRGMQVDSGSVVDDMYTQEFDSGTVPKDSVLAATVSDHLPPARGAQQQRQQQRPDAHSSVETEDVVMTDSEAAHRQTHSGSVETEEERRTGTGDDSAPSSSGQTSQLAADMERQARQLQAELERKQAQLKMQLQKQAIDALKKQIAAVEDQLQAAASPTRKTQPRGKQGARQSVATTSSISDSQSHTLDSSGMDLGRVRQPRGRRTTSSAVSVEDSRSAASVSEATSHSPSHVRSEGGSQGSSAGHTHTDTSSSHPDSHGHRHPQRKQQRPQQRGVGGVRDDSGDSLEAAARQVEVLQQQLESKRREARRTQLAAQQAALEQQLAAATQEAATARAQLQRSVNVPLSIATGGVRSHALTDPVRASAPARQQHAASSSIATESVDHSGSFDQADTVPSSSGVEPSEPHSRSTHPSGASQDSIRTVEDSQVVGHRYPAHASSSSEAPASEAATEQGTERGGVGSQQRTSGSSSATRDVASGSTQYSQDAFTAAPSSQDTDAISGSIDHSDRVGGDGAGSQSGSRQPRSSADTPQDLLAGLHDINELDDQLIPEDEVEEEEAQVQDKVESTARAPASDEYSMDLEPTAVSVGSGTVSVGSIAVDDIEYSQDSVGSRGSSAAAGSQLDVDVDAAVPAMAASLHGSEAAASIQSDASRAASSEGAASVKSDSHTEGKSASSDGRSAMGHILLDVEDLQVADDAESSALRQPSDLEIRPPSSLLQTRETEPLSLSVTWQDSLEVQEYPAHQQGSSGERSSSGSGDRSMAAASDYSQAFDSDDDRPLRSARSSRSRARSFIETGEGAGSGDSSVASSSSGSTVQSIRRRLSASPRGIPGEDSDLDGDEEHDYGSASVPELVLPPRASVTEPEAQAPTTSVPVQSAPASQATQPSETHLAQSADDEESILEEDIDYGSDEEIVVGDTPSAAVPTAPARPAALASASGALAGAPVLAPLAAPAITRRTGGVPLSQSDDRGEVLLDASELLESMLAVSEEELLAEAQQTQDPATPHSPPTASAVMQDQSATTDIAAVAAAAAATAAAIEVAAAAAQQAGSSSGVSDQTETDRKRSSSGSGAVLEAPSVQASSESVGGPEQEEEEEDGSDDELLGAQAAFNLTSGLDDDDDASGAASQPSGEESEDLTQYQVTSLHEEETDDEETTVQGSQQTAAQVPTAATTIPDKSSSYSLDEEVEDDIEVAVEEEDEEEEDTARAIPAASTTTPAPAPTAHTASEPGTDPQQASSATLATTAAAGIVTAAAVAVGMAESETSGIRVTQSSGGGALPPDISSGAVVVPRLSSSQPWTSSDSQTLDVQPQTLDATATADAPSPAAAAGGDSAGAGAAAVGSAESADERGVEGEGADGEQSGVDEESESAASVVASDYSMSFDGLEVDLEVDASPVSTPRRGDTTSQAEVVAGQQNGVTVSEDGMVDRVTDRIWSEALSESVQTMVSVAGGPESLSPSKARPGTTSPTTSPPTPAMVPAAASAAPKSHSLTSDLPPLPTAGNRGLRRVDSTDSDGSDGFGTSAQEYTAEDLGWGDEDFGDDYQLNLGAYLVPEHDQEIIKKEQEAAAAPAVNIGPQVVAHYLRQVLQTREKDHGPWPEELMPGEEPLSLEGFIAMGRSIPDASEAQHIAYKMLYDATNEAIINLYKSANRIKIPSWLRSKRPVRPLPSSEQLIMQVTDQVTAWLAVAASETELDKLLSADAVEDEREWSALKEEVEAELRLELAEAIWDDLIDDTASTLAELDAKLA